MKKSLYNFIKKQGLLLWAISAALTMTIMYVSAEYMGENSVMKRVVVADSEQRSMFSSNILKENGTNNYQAQYVSALSETEIAQNKQYDVSLILWNYNRANPSKWYPQDISYTLNAKLVNQDGTPITEEELEDSKTITILKDNEEKCTLSSLNLEHQFSDELTYKTSGTSDNVYTIRFSNNWNLQDDMDICLQIIATPDKNGDADKYKDISEISAIVGLRELQRMGASGWQVYLNEQRMVGTPKDYDAFNLVVTGSGKADIIITIDTNKLSFNKYFYDESLRIKDFSKNGSEKEVEYKGPDEYGLAVLTIKADASANRGTPDNPEYRNRYDIQLYKNYDSNTGDPVEWDFIAENSEIANAVWITYNVTNN